MIINDKPSLYDDQLNYKKYAKALAKVIKDAETPFTIGISGEWGYGKTTLMKYVSYYLDEKHFNEIKEKNDKEKNDKEKNDEEKLKPFSKEMKKDIGEFHKEMKEDEKKYNYNTIFLDTWPFINSQDIGESIFEQIMYELIKFIKKNEKPEFEEVGKFLLKTIGATLKTVKFNGKLKLGFGEVGASFDPSKFSMDDMFVTDGVYKNLKIEVEDILHEITKKLGKLVIFIDDLDILYPKQALEVIIFIKNFLTVENCIFVIGTDNEVLKEGLEELYGKYGNDRDSKGRKEYLRQIKDNFFEKIYQLEFKIPLISDNDVDEYISKFSDFNDYNIRKEIINMLKFVVPTMNLRKIKKIINTYYLIKQLGDINSISIDIYDIFRVAILQNTYYFTDVKYRLIYGEYRKGFEDNKNLESLLKNIGFNYNSVSIKRIFSILGSIPKSDKEILEEYIEKFIKSETFYEAENNYNYLYDYLQNTNLQGLSDKYLVKLLDGIKGNIKTAHNQILEANDIGDEKLKKLIEILSSKSLKRDKKLIDKINEFISYLPDYNNRFNSTINYLNEVKDNVNEDDNIPF